MPHHTVVTGLVLSLLAPSVSPAAVVGPPQGRVDVAVVAVSGSGCPAGSVAAYPTMDNATVLVYDAALFVQVGVGARPTDIRSNCLAALQITPPSGYSYAVRQVRHHGYASLEPGASGQERTRFYFQGDPSPVPVTHPFTGPTAESWDWSTEVVADDALVWSSCGTPSTLILVDELRVAAGTSDPATTTSFIVKDDIDSPYSSQFQLAWQTC